MLLSQNCTYFFLGGYLQPARELNVNSFINLLKLFTNSQCLYVYIGE